MNMKYLRFAWKQSFDWRFPQVRCVSVKMYPNTLDFHHQDTQFVSRAYLFNVIQFSPLTGFLEDCIYVGRYSTNIMQIHMYTVGKVDGTTPRMWLSMLSKRPWSTNTWELSHLLSRWHTYLYIPIYMNDDVLSHDVTNPSQTWQQCFPEVVLGSICHSPNFKGKQFHNPKANLAQKNYPNSA